MCHTGIARPGQLYTKAIVCDLSLYAETTQLSDHERRPEGPLKPEANAATRAEQAVRSSLVVASDLPGQVSHPLLFAWRLVLYVLESTGRHVLVHYNHIDLS